MNGDAKPAPVKRFEDGSRTFHVKPHSGTYGEGVHGAVTALRGRVVKVKPATASRAAASGSSKSA